MNNKEVAAFMGLADEWRNVADKIEKFGNKTIASECLASCFRQQADEVDKILNELTKQYGIQILK